MDLEKIYYDQDDNECNILQLVKKEPEWAANRIQVGEAAIRALDDVAASQWQHAVDAEGCIHCDSGEEIPSGFNFCPYCGCKPRR